MPTQPRPRWERFRWETRRLRRKSDVAHTKSISNAANNKGVSWTIGSKPNVNSNEGCFGASRRFRKRIRDIRGLEARTTPAAVDKDRLICMAGGGGGGVCQG